MAVATMTIAKSASNQILVTQVLHHTMVIQGGQVTISDTAEVAAYIVQQWRRPIHMYPSADDQAGEEQCHELRAYVEVSISPAWVYPMQAAPGYLLTSVLSVLLLMPEGHQREQHQRYCHDTEYNPVQNVPCC